MKKDRTFFVFGIGYCINVQVIELKRKTRYRQKKINYYLFNK
jgi:hypothetical protein